MGNAPHPGGRTPGLGAIGESDPLVATGVDSPTSWRRHMPTTDASSHRSGPRLPSPARTAGRKRRERVPQRLPKLTTSDGREEHRRELRTPKTPRF